VSSSPEGSTAPAEATTDDTAQSELDLGVVSTGSAQVDAALQPLESLGEREVSSHADVFEQVLADLSATMSAEPAGPDDALVDGPADHPADNPLD
jgi:hypothetical protein